MNRPVCCEGDATTHGGKVIEGIPLVLHGHHSLCGCAVVCNANAIVAT